MALARGGARWRRAALHPALIAYVLATMAAVVFSRDPVHSVGEVGELLTLALVPLVVSLIDVRRWDRLLIAMTVVAVASAALGLFQYLNGASSLSDRLRGLTNHYMTFSGWTLIASLLLLGDVLFHRDRTRLVWTAPAFALCATALALSYTRGAWIGLGASLVLAALLWRPKALYLYPVLVMALVLALPGSVLARAVSIVDLEQPSNHDRLCMARSALEMVQENPLFGVGMGMVKRCYPEYRRDDALRPRVPHLHNNLLQICAERGLFGVASYVLILGVFFVHAWMTLRRAGPATRPAIIGCVLAVAGVSVAGLFEYNWGDAEVWIPTLAVLAAPSGLAKESP